MFKKLSRCFISHKFAIPFLFTVNVVSAMDIKQADDLYLEKNYTTAHDAYLELSEVGNARAFYQLGVLNLNGYGIPQNRLKAFLWFDLASEQKYQDSEQIVADILSSSKPEIQEKLTALAENFRKEYGWEYISKYYFPNLNAKSLHEKIYFGSTSEKYYVPNKFADLEAMEFDNYILDLLESREGGEFEWDKFFFGRTMSQSSTNRPYSAVIDYEIAQDGTSRNIEEFNVVGKLDSKVKLNLQQFLTDKPQFANGKNATFISRAYVGLAGFTLETIQKRYQQLYVSLYRECRKLKASESIDDQYQYVMTLMGFQWLPREDGEIDKILDALAVQGHPLAQYEYGLKLYREQRDIPKAIYWIGEAAKSGVARAEYRLGKLMLDSPWVKNDEIKALFWFESASKKQYTAAKLGAAEIRLMSKNLKLRNQEIAQIYLSSIPNTEQDSPKYEYLKAMSYFNKVPRELSNAVKSMRVAIDLADKYNWDTADWQSTLEDWTSGGRITVTDQPTASTE